MAESENLLGRFLDLSAKIATPFVQDLASRRGASDSEIRTERQYWNTLNGSGAVDGAGFVASGSNTRNLEIPQFNPNAQDSPMSRNLGGFLTKLSPNLMVGLIVVVVLVGVLFLRKGIR